jgi:hypothetical protein
MAGVNYEREIALLEWEWAPESGFFWKLRQGVYDHNEFQRALGKPSSISVPDAAKRRDPAEASAASPLAVTRSRVDC